MAKQRIWQSSTKWKFWEGIILSTDQYIRNAKRESDPEDYLQQQYWSFGSDWDQNRSAAASSEIFQTIGKPGEKKSASQFNIECFAAGEKEQVLAQTKHAVVVTHFKHFHTCKQFTHIHSMP